MSRSQTTKPVWLLDVDGVINAMNHQPQYRAIWVRAAGKEWKIRYSKPLVDRISFLSEKIDIKWCTTWGQYAADSLAPALGLPKFPVVEPQNEDIETYHALVNFQDWWKFRRFQLLLHHRIIWTDDDIPKEVLKDYPESAGELLIRPHSNRGLTMKDLDKIEAFADYVYPTS